MLSNMQPPLCCAAGSPSPGFHRPVQQGLARFVVFVALTPLRTMHAMCVVPECSRVGGFG